MRRLTRILLLILSIIFIVGCGAEDRKQTYFDRGMALFESNNYTNARLEFKNVLQIDPKDAQAWLMLGQIAEAEKEWRTAFKAYEKAVALDPQNAAARVKKGQLLLTSKRTEDALAEAQTVLTGNPSYADGLALRGAVRVHQGDLEAAADDALAILQTDSEHRNALLLLAGIRARQDDTDAAKALLEKGIQAHPADVILRQSLADIYQQRGEFERARTMLEQLVEIEPKELVHHARLAEFLTEQGQVDAAERVLRGAVADDPDRLQAKLLLVAFATKYRGVDSAAAVLDEFIAKESGNYALRYALADLYLSALRPEDAESVYRTMIAHDGLGPDGLRARGRLAGLLLATDRRDEAEALAAEVLAEDPRDAEALIARAAIALERDDTNQAIGDLRMVLDDVPDSTRALRLLAKAHVTRQELALAEDALKKAIEAAPREPPAYLDLARLRVESGDMEGASVILERLLAQVPDNTVAQDALARIQLSEQDWGAMEKTAERILSIRPEHPLGYYFKGLILQRKGQLEESVVQFEKALDKRPNALDPALALARSQVALGQPEKAVKGLKQLLEIAPGSTAALNLLGQVYASMERFPDAKAQFERVIASDRTSPIAYVRLAEVQAQWGDIDAAIKTLRAGVEATERNAFLVFRLGMMLQEAGQYDPAEAAYEEVLKSNPEAQAAVNNLAMLLVNHLGDDPANLDRALELAQRFEDSEQPFYQDTLGWVHFRRGDYAKAAAILEKTADSLDPVPAEVQYHLGMVYVKLGRIEKAKRHLSSAVNAGGPFTGIDEAREALEGL